MDLIDSVRYGDTAEVKRLLKSGINVEAQDDDGYTALIWAAFNGRLEIVEALLKAGANVDAQSNGIGLTALMIAALKGHLAIVEALLKANPNLNLRDRDGYTAKDYAREKYHLAIVQVLEEAQRGHMLQGTTQSQSSGFFPTSSMSGGSISTPVSTPSSSVTQAKKSAIMQNKASYRNWQKSQQQRRTNQQVARNVGSSSNKKTGKIRTVQEQIKYYVEHGKSFMLHGPSGTGKTARIREIDRDLTSVPLWNGVLPEDVVGKVVYPNGEIVAANESENKKQGGVWIASSWYREVCRKAEAEPEKYHVLFIDEVTNARETTQSLIFHLVLNRSITPSDGKLPKNVTVVLAGNSKAESGAAYNMPEPLFRRMAGHIYLEDNIQEWIEWGSQANYENPERANIHPLITGFIAAEGAEVFRTRYVEDEEEEGIREQYAIDPRGWEQISDMIYDNEGIEEELIKNKIGPEMTEALKAYASMPKLDVKEIISGEYAAEEIPGGVDERTALVGRLSLAKEAEYEPVRAFIKEELGEEYVVIYDTLWVGENADRAMLVDEVQKREKVEEGKAGAQPTLLQCMKNGRDDR